MESTPTKQWKKIKVFDTYQEASTLKNQLLNEPDNADLEVKIRRCGPMGTKFKVKTWRPSPASSKSKKGKTNV